MEKIFKKNYMRRGQLLIEMLVALGILTVGFLAVTSLLSRAIGLNRVVSDNYTATYLAAEGVEVMKNILDSDRLNGRGWGTSLPPGDYEVDYATDNLTGHLSQNRFLTYDPDTHAYGYNFSKTTLFVRTVSVALSGNEIIVNSKIQWTSRGGGNFDVNVEDHFFNWK